MISQKHYDKKLRDIILVYCFPPQWDILMNEISCWYLKILLCYLQTKSIKWGNNSKIMKGRVIIHVHCTPPQLVLFNVWSFKLIFWIPFVLSSRQKFSIKRGNNSKLMKGRVIIHIYSPPPQWNLSMNEGSFKYIPEILENIIIFPAAFSVGE